MYENARYLEVSAAVRYWEDAVLNGEVDTEGKIPLRNGELWEPVIELATGQVQDWPVGSEASVHYKVCDAGEYWLLDEHKARIAKWKGFYVPRDVLPDGGDYIILKIGGDGRILNWRQPGLEEERWAEVVPAKPAAVERYARTRVEKHHGRLIVCGDVLPASQLRRGQVWQDSAGATVTVLDTDNLDWVRYESVRDGERERDIFGFQTRYSLVVSEEEAAQYAAPEGE